MPDIDLVSLAIKLLGYNLAVNLVCRAIHSRVESLRAMAASTPSPVDDTAVSRLEQVLDFTLLVTGTLRDLSELGVFRKPKR